MSGRTAYDAARERYAAFGIDTDAAVEKALNLPISLHCWQTDDVGGFETKPEGLDGGGIMATGNYPGRARTGDEARADLEKAMALLPGTQRVNLHACYAETDHFVDRDALDASCFHRWIEWGKGQGINLDFNPTFFAHPKAESGFTLSHADDAIRTFWIEHGKACRRIAQAMADAQGAPCHVNWWTPDGSKDIPADRWAPRARMAAAYDAILADQSIDRTQCVDFIESKLFGIGSEEYVVASSEFCANYAVSRDMGLCMDMGHFHPTETIHGKISSHLTFMDRILLHVSRPIRWDSDHVVIFNDDLKNVFLEIQRGAAWDRVVLALDFFDASINRLAAYVIGARATRKAILYAMLDPTEQLQDHECAGRNTQRLALMEEFKSMPFGTVWDTLCEKAGVPVGTDWIAEMEAYEQRCSQSAGNGVRSVEQLETIVALSHAFGTTDYVTGGGGNTSAKDETTLWVKPSGTTLANLTAESFVAMNRAAIDSLYAVDTPKDPAAREELVRDLLAEAVQNDAGRPSVEAPLHNSFDTVYVVHTHPSLVNGMTCAKRGAEACADLFPDAMWVEYIDPGYTLCMDVRKRLEAWRREKGADPELVILKNHGIFVAGNKAEAVRESFGRVMSVLGRAYADAGCSPELSMGPQEGSEETEAAIRACFGEGAAYLAHAGVFDCVPGPITPDHLVYARAFPFTAELTPRNATAYVAGNGCTPKVVVTANGVYGLGTTQRRADLALEMAKDGARVMQLAEAFGGIAFMTDAARTFIENWEVESYRLQQV